MATPLRIPAEHVSAILGPVFATGAVSPRRAWSPDPAVPRAQRPQETDDQGIPLWDVSAVALRHGSLTITVPSALPLLMAPESPLALGDVTVGVSKAGAFWWRAASVQAGEVEA
ncbi:hypothetical protein E4P35_13155 [Thiopseudomonas sp. 4R-3cl]|nr:hypothetical protein E4P35_13155 [Thiopseudomonas sp. 4R-3cl]